MFFAYNSGILGDNEHIVFVSKALPMPQSPEGRAHQRPPRLFYQRALFSAVISCLVVLLVGTAQADPKTFRMAFAKAPAQDVQHLFYQKIYTQAFAKLGYEFDFIVAPNKRCSYLLQSGQVDGEPQRIKSYEQQLENIIHVDEPIFVNRNIIVGRTGSAKIERLAQLQQKNIHVDYARGSLWSEQHLRDVLPSTHIHAVDSFRQGLIKTKYGRTDYFLGLETPTIEVLNSPEFKDSKLTVLGIVGQNNSYPYFHQKHKDLAQQMATILQDMKKSGEYDAILYSVLPFLRPNN